MSRPRIGGPAAAPGASATAIRETLAKTGSDGGAGVRGARAAPRAPDRVAPREAGRGGGRGGARRLGGPGDLCRDGRHYGRRSGRRARSGSEIVIVPLLMSVTTRSIERESRRANERPLIGGGRQSSRPS